MNKNYLPTVGRQDWQKLLADPEKQWRTGYSARTIAYAWEAAKGHFPEAELLLESGKTYLKSASL